MCCRRGLHIEPMGKLTLTWTELDGFSQRGSQLVRPAQTPQNVLVRVSLLIVGPNAPSRHDVHAGQRARGQHHQPAMYASVLR